MTELKLRALKALLEEYVKELDQEITIRNVGRCVQQSLEDAQDPIKDNRYSDTTQEGESHGVRTLVLLDVVHDSFNLEAKEEMFGEAFPDAAVTWDTIIEEKVSLSLTAGLLEDRGADPEYICPEPSQKLFIDAKVENVADLHTLDILEDKVVSWLRAQEIAFDEGPPMLWVVNQRDHERVLSHIKSVEEEFKVKFLVEWE